MEYLVYLLAAIGATANTQSMPTPPAPPAPPAPSIIMVPTISVPPTAPKKGEPSLATPKNFPGSWANMRDYPAAALRDLREGIVSFTVDVTVNGRVEKCTITSSSGHSDLDKATCENVTARAQFYPAQDKNGLPITGTYANRVRWQIPEVLSMASMPKIGESLPRPPRLSKQTQLAVPVEKYPIAAAAAGQQGQTAFLLDVNVNGKVRECIITTSSSFPELDQQTCSIAREWIFEPALDIEGKPSAGKSAHTLSWRLPKRFPRVSMAAPRPVTNPLAKPGSLTLSIEFNDKGKLTDCKTEIVGDGVFGGSLEGQIKSACDTGVIRDVPPFLDSTGKPVAKRVTLKVSIELEDRRTDALNK